MDKKLCFILLLCISVVLPQSIGSGSNGNLRLCVVEGRGSYKRAGKFCPVLDQEKAGVECVLGTDRLDCLRRMSKGTVDLGVFSPEDLVAAQWADLDVLVTNQLKSRRRSFERSIVAVVNRQILPESSSTVEAVLRGSTLCHPGVGAEDIKPLSDTLAEYLESVVTQKSCEPALSLAENRLQALAGFFGKACRAGPWVNDERTDRELKDKYPSLCQACGSTCNTNDRFWGTSGAMACLAERGDVTWADLDDVAAYFGLTAGSQQFADPTSFRYLCRDGTWQPLTGNPRPCVWLNKPWRVVVAKRKAAEAVSRLAGSLTNTSVTVDFHWHGALAALLETNQALPEPLHPPQAPLDYLASARGFREAYSIAGCHPPRHITLCTSTLIEKNKCEWLSEAAAVYGVAPPLQCAFRQDGGCADDVRAGQSDVFVGDSDMLVAGERNYSISPILHESTPIVERTNTVVAYARKNSKISKMSDLRGKRTFFPRFDGYAWHAVLKYLRDSEKESCKVIFINFFSEICAPGIENADISDDIKAKYLMGCYKEGDKVLEGESQALRALAENKTDVVFVSMNSYVYAAKQNQEPWAREMKNIIPICPEENKRYCFISWSNIGHIYTRKNITDMRRHEIINVFTKLDQLFGKNYPFHNAMFSMYGPFNHKANIIFHNNTKTLTSDYTMNSYPYNKIPMYFEKDIHNVCDLEELSKDGAVTFSAKILGVLLSLVIVLLLS